MAFFQNWKNLIDIFFEIGENDNRICILVFIYIPALFPKATLRSLDDKEINNQIFLKFWTWILFDKKFNLVKKNSQYCSFNQNMICFKYHNIIKNYNILLS